MIKCSLDLDDTIVSFTDHYISKFGKPKSDSEISKNVSGILLKDKSFWLTQPLINKPNFKVHSYCTARLIKKDWIKKQLEINDLPKAPVYQVFGYSHSKIPQLKRSGCDVHIDDSVRVFKDCLKNNIPCLLMDSPNNRYFQTDARIYSLNYNEIELIYNSIYNVN